MERAMVIFAVLALFAGNTLGARTLLQTPGLICAGAQGASTACAAPCSGTVVNDDVVAGSNTGKFNVGENNDGDGNDGFNNIGDFNIGSGNEGNCADASGATGGSCDPSNNNGQIVLRFCNVYPTDPKCTPSGYLPQYTSALISQIETVVASCNGGGPLSPPPPASPPPPPSPPTAVAPGTPPTALPPIAPTPATPTPPTVTMLPALVPGVAQLTDFFPVSATTADLGTLSDLLAEFIAAQKAAGK